MEIAQTRSASQRFAKRVRWLCAANILLAGIPEATSHLRPRTKRRGFAPGRADRADASRERLGPLLLSLALLPAAGLRSPRPFTGVLATRLAYQGLGLASAASQLVRDGRSRLPLAAAFGALSTWMPRKTWRELLGRPAPAELEGSFVEVDIEETVGF
jgi:hypothetical protein